MCFFCCVFSAQPTLCHVYRWDELIKNRRDVREGSGPGNDSYVIISRSRD